MGIQKIWPSLPQDMLKSLESSFLKISLKRGDIVYRPGENPRGIYLVDSGLVGLIFLAESGKEHLLRFFRKDQYFGHRSLFSNEVYHAQSIALEPSELRLIPKNVVLEVLRMHPVLFEDVARVWAAELGQAERQHVMILENQILPRVAQALIYLKDMEPSHNWTRQEIANFTASTVSTVIKAMAELEDLGLIKQSGRVFEIVDRAGLLSLQENI
jgi:CRP-like cAMP-binding protein